MDDLLLEVCESELCELILQKTDSIETEKGLKGATFQVVYKPFSQWSGEEPWPIQAGRTWGPIRPVKTAQSLWMALNPASTG